MEIPVSKFKVHCASAFSKTTLGLNPDQMDLSCSRALEEAGEVTTDELGETLSWMIDLERQGAVINKENFSKIKKKIEDLLSVRGIQA